MAALCSRPAQCGEHPAGRKSYGHSLIVDPWGEVLADGGEEPGFVTATIDPARIAEARGMVPSLRHDRDFTPPARSPPLAGGRVTPTRGLAADLIEPQFAADNRGLPGNLTLRCCDDVFTLRRGPLQSKIMRVLYHLTLSPLARKVRVMLAEKKPSNSP